LAVLRDAFMATTRDRELQAEVKKLPIDIEPTTGGEVQEILLITAAQMTL
jgi:hypothetical protein